MDRRAAAGATAGVNADVVVARFANLRRTHRGWSARCPAHDDRSNSLSLAIGADRRTLVHCFAGCRVEAIVHAIELELHDLFPDDRPRARQARPGSPLEAARHDVIREARRQVERIRLAGYQGADEIRWCYQIVGRTRDVATQLGESPAAWTLLSRAAELERMTMAAEAAA